MKVKNQICHKDGLPCKEKDCFLWSVELGRCVEPELKEMAQYITSLPEETQRKAREFLELNYRILDRLN